LILPRTADWYDFQSRYAALGSEHRCPAAFEPSLTECIQRVAVETHRAPGARDLSRADFVIRDEGGDGAVTLLEVNTLPGTTPTSLFPEAAAIAGVPFVKLCDQLVRRALARPARRGPEVAPMPEADG
jgi:D-alanine-D-alanine ligase